MALRKTKNSNNDNNSSEKKGISSFIIVFVIMLVVFLLGAGLAFGYFKIFASDKQDSQKESKKEILLSSMELADIVVNLDGSDGHFLKTEIVIEYPKDKKIEEMVKEKKSHIIEAVLVTLRKKTIEEVSPPNATEKLKEELINSINNRLNEKVVKNIIFTQYIVQ